VGVTVGFKSGWVARKTNNTVWVRAVLITYVNCHHGGIQAITPRSLRGERYARAFATERSCLRALIKHVSDKLNLLNSSVQELQNEAFNYTGLLDTLRKKQREIGRGGNRKEATKRK